MKIVHSACLLLLIVIAGCGDDSSPVQTAPDQPGLAFDEVEAQAANGELPKADAKTVCGADDRRFLAELVNGASPLNYKIPKRLADIKPAPSEVMVSGVAVGDASLGTGDFPFDHTFGSDLNMGVELDTAYDGVGQEFGTVRSEVHVELAEGQLPHIPAAPGPPTGQEWEAMSNRAREGIYDRFLPRKDDRVLVKGHWIVDCGHTDFGTEIHPITFLARGRVIAGKTVVDAFYNPYRETQLYHPDPNLALAFDSPSRFQSRATAPFPRGLITSIARIQGFAPEPYKSLDHLESWALLEPNLSSPAAWRVCAPAGSRGTRLEVKYHWITRPGAHIEVVLDEASSCALVHTTLGSAEIAAPMARVCTLPWDWLDRVAGAEAGIDGLNLRNQLRPFVAPQFQSGLDPAPIMNCYDPLFGPALEDDPTGQRIETDEGLLLPFYGTISVGFRHLQSEASGS